MSDTEIDQTITNEEAEEQEEQEVLTGPVEMQVQSRMSANSVVATRWGDVEFDKEGLATLTLPAEDIGLLDQLQWLLPSDRAKLLGSAVRTESPEEAGFKSARSKLAELQARHAEMVSSAEAEIQRLSKENDTLRGELEEAQAKIAVLGKDVSELRASITAVDAKAKAKAAKAAKAKNKS